MTTHDERYRTGEPHLLPPDPRPRSPVPEALEMTRTGYSDDSLPRMVGIGSTTTPDEALSLAAERFAATKNVVEAIAILVTYKFCGNNISKLFDRACARRAEPTVCALIKVFTNAMVSAEADAIRYEADALAARVLSVSGASGGESLAELARKMAEERECAEKKLGRRFTDEERGRIERR